MNSQINSQEVAKALREIAAVLEIKKDTPFRISAFKRAAESVEKLPTTQLKNLWQKEQLQEIPGIGESLAQSLDELLKTGQVKEFNALKKQVPQSIFVLITIPGIGPKKAYRLAQGLKIKKADQVIKKLLLAGRQGKISQLSGFGKKSQQEILDNIKRKKVNESKSTRMLLFQADELSQEITTYLKKSSAVLVVKPLGSLRRRVETIGDLDLAVKTKKPKKVIAHFVNFPEKQEILTEGKKSSSRILLNNGRQVDLRVFQPRNAGSMLQHFTGSKEHNINLRELAQKKGLSLSEYGIKNLENNKTFHFEKEKDFYRFLNLDWIPPELRENQGEIAAAQKSQLPKLVKLSDIKGDLHIHSNFPIEPAHDLGQASIKEILSWATAKKYQYFALTEHNPSQRGHRKNEVVALIKKKRKLIDQINYSQIKSIKNRSKKLPFVFNSLEIDIKPNGDFALPEEAFEYLDFAIVGIHSQFYLKKEAMTQRIIKSLSHDKVKILAHPTGRILGKRPLIEADWDKIFAFCKKKNKIIEINASPYRLDLPDFLIRKAIKQKIKLAINTDSHKLDQLKFMTYGIACARRGWTEKKDIINTMPLDKIKKILLSF
jgi:DNA polymerase (family X)